MSGLGIIGLAIVISVIATCVIEIKEDNITLSIVLPIMAIIGLSIMIVSLSITPTALDVYKGKTELQITYKGTIPIDSVVVFKNK
jgi:hypothetical protein